MIKSLSPAAQAVLDAATFRHGCIPASIAAAALQAAADQVVPERLKGPTGSGFRWGAWAAKSGVRSKFLTIAAELEGINA